MKSIFRNLATVAMLVFLYPVLAADPQSLDGCTESSCTGPVNGPESFNTLACGVPLDILKQEGVAGKIAYLNRYNQPNRHRQPAKLPYKLGMYNNGANCGRWIQGSSWAALIADACSGTSGPGASQGQPGYCWTQPYNVGLIFAHISSSPEGWKFIPASTTDHFNIYYSQYYTKYFPQLIVSNLKNGISSLSICKNNTVKECDSSNNWFPVFHEYSQGQVFDLPINQGFLGGTTVLIKVRDINGKLSEKACKITLPTRSIPSGKWQNANCTPVPPIAPSAFDTEFSR